MTTVFDITRYVTNVGDADVAALVQFRATSTPEVVETTRLLILAAPRRLRQIAARRND